MFDDSRERHHRRFDVTQSNRLDTQFEHRNVIIKYDIINIIVRYDNEIVNNSIKRAHRLEKI